MIPEHVSVDPCHCLVCGRSYSSKISDIVVRPSSEAGPLRSIELEIADWERQSFSSFVVELVERYRGRVCVHGGKISFRLNPEECLSIASLIEGYRHNVFPWGETLIAFLHEQERDGL